MLYDIRRLSGCQSNRAEQLPTCSHCNSSSPCRGIKQRSRYSRMLVLFDAKSLASRCWQIAIVAACFQRSEKGPSSDAIVSHQTAFASEVAVTSACRSSLYTVNPTGGTTTLATSTPSALRRPKARYGNAAVWCTHRRSSSRLPKISLHRQFLRLGPDKPGFCTAASARRLAEIPRLDRHAGATGRREERRSHGSCEIPLL